jgi:hypothetical protein
MAPAIAPRYRGFGEPADLAVDFGEPVLATLVTRLRAACRADGPAESDAREAEARALTLSGRIAALCAVVARTPGAAPVELELRCPAPGCGEPLEVELPLDALVELGEAAEHEPVLELEGGNGATLRVRRPTGEDQRRWRARAFASAEEATRAVLVSLLVDGGASTAPDGALVERVGAAMEERDPLPDFHLTSHCPACGAESDHPLELEPLLAARLERRQRGMLREVHRLASRYGWTEREVMALPEHRRRAYLEMIDSEAS